MISRQLFGPVSSTGTCLIAARRDGIKRACHLNGGVRAWREADGPLSQVQAAGVHNTCAFHAFPL